MPEPTPADVAKAERLLRRKKNAVQRVAKLIAARRTAIAWLRCIRDDNRNGRGEIMYDEFAYRRREGEYRAAARNALKQIGASR